jgi:DNA-binding response OmpR family regulator
MKILVIDDDCTVCGYLKHVIEKEGHIFACAHRGTEGFVMSDQVKPDAVFIDLGISFGDGMDLAEEIGCLRTAIISGDLEDREVEIASKGWFALSKPFELSDLLDLLREFDEQVKEEFTDTYKYGDSKAS